MDLKTATADQGKSKLKLMTDDTEAPKASLQLKDPYQNSNTDIKTPHDIMFDLKQSPLLRIDDEYKQIFDNPVYLYNASPEASPILPEAQSDNINSPLFLDMNQYTNLNSCQLSSTRKNRPSLFFQNKLRNDEMVRQKQSSSRGIFGKLQSRAEVKMINNQQQQQQQQQQQGNNIVCKQECDYNDQQIPQQNQIQQKQWQIQKNHLFPFIEDEVNNNNNNINNNNYEQQQKGSSNKNQPYNQQQSINNQPINTTTSNYNCQQQQQRTNSFKDLQQQDFGYNNNNGFNNNAHQYQENKTQYNTNNFSTTTNNINNTNNNFQNDINININFNLNQTPTLKPIPQVSSENSTENTDLSTIAKEEDLQQSFDRMQLKEEYLQQNNLYNLQNSNILQLTSNNDQNTNNGMSFGNGSIKHSSYYDHYNPYQAKKEEIYDEIQEEQKVQGNGINNNNNNNNINLNVSFYEMETHKKHKILNSPLIPLDNKKAFDYKSDLFLNGNSGAGSNSFNFQHNEFNYQNDLNITQTNKNIHQYLSKTCSEHDSQSTYVIDTNSVHSHQSQLNNTNNHNNGEQSQFSQYSKKRQRDQQGDKKSNKKDKEKQPPTQEKLIKKARNNGVYTFWKSYLEFITSSEFLQKKDDIIYQFVEQEIQNVLNEDPYITISMELFQQKLKLHYEKEKKMSAQTLSELLNLQEYTYDSQNRILEMWEKRLIKISFKEWLKTDYPEKYIEASLRKTKGNGSDSYSKNIRQIGWNQALNQMRKSSSTDFKSMTREFNKNQFKNNLDNCNF